MTQVDFSLNLLIGLLIEYINSPLVNKFSKFAIENMFKKHPKIFDKISTQDKDVVIAICPVDMPYVFLIYINNYNPFMIATSYKSKIYFDAKITGNLKDLLLMFEGKIDGDAAFFSKKINIEGNTTLILKIRNAIDSEQIDILKDFSQSLFMFDKSAYKILKNVLNKYNKINDKLLIIKESITSKSIDIAYNNLYKIDELEENIKKIEKKIEKTTRDKIRKKSDYYPKNMEDYKQNTILETEENEDGYL